MPHDEYPQTVAEILDGSMTFKAETLRAMRAFREAKPWSGTLEERMRKLCTLNRELATIYGVAEPELVFGAINGTSSSGSYYSPPEHRIVLTGKLSVVTYLHEFCHARGMGEHNACRWSINLFRQAFPNQFGKLAHVGHMLIRPEDAAKRIS